MADVRKKVLANVTKIPWQMSQNMGWQMSGWQLSHNRFCINLLILIIILLSSSCHHLCDHHPHLNNWLVRHHCHHHSPISNGWVQIIIFCCFFFSHSSHQFNQKNTVTSVSTFHTFNDILQITPLLRTPLFFSLGPRKHFWSSQFFFSHYSDIYVWE